MFDVSRETMARCQALCAQLHAWQQRHNLVSRTSLTQFWHRHMADSAQILPLLPPADAGCIMDLGSGAGFPGLVLALLRPPEASAPIVLVEAQRKKVDFLRHMQAELGAPVRVLHRRVEEVTARDLPHAPAVLVARALKPLPQLLDMTEKFFTRANFALFFKGRSWAKELTLARQCWTMDATAWASITEEAAAILQLRRPRRLH